MKKFKRIKAYNKKYREELEESLKIINPYLIDAFTKYYGEEYKDKITDVISNIMYTFFISEPFLKVLNCYGSDISKHDKRVCKYYLKYLHACQMDELDKCIVCSNLEKEDLLESDFIDCLKTNFSFYTVVSDDEEKYFYHAIFLPVFAISLKIIVHEINHAFMTEVVAVTKKEWVAPNLFVYPECEELFNDYITNKIIRKYTGIIPYPLKKFHYVHQYESFFKLIKMFYDTFEDVIKISIMTKDFNLLWECVGKEDFHVFCSLIKEYYLQDGFTEEEVANLEELVLKMSVHASSVVPEDFDSYINELESLGYRVRKLVK